MRSKLFVPACRPELFPKALASAADSICLDMEDSVPTERKAEARATVAQALRSAEFTASSKVIIVRVNAWNSADGAADLAEVVCPRLDLLNVPKIESADEIRALCESLLQLEHRGRLARPTKLLTNIESPRGLQRAAEIAEADPRVVGLQLGFGDLFEPLGIDRTNGEAVRQVQLSVRLAAGHAGIWAYDAAFGNIKDPAGFKSEAAAAKRLGFLGKTCIHPSQIALANEVFQPSADDIAWAHRVVNTAAEMSAKGLGAFSLDGRMIDKPFLERARQIVAVSRNDPASGK
ncbi:MAG: CoA ester lyase [Opitutus sp.]